MRRVPRVATVSSRSAAVGRRCRRSLVVLVVLSLVMVLLPTIALAEGDGPPPATVSEEVDGFRLAAREGEWQVSEVATAPIAFTMIGFAAPEGAELVARVASDDWSDWFPLVFIDPDDGPDVASVEARDGDRAREDDLAHTEPVWVGEADQVQVRVAGADLDDLTATIIDADGLSRGFFRRVADAFRPAAASAASAAPQALEVISRREWGADESKRNGNPRFADDVRYAVVHHTAHGLNANGYTRTQAAGIVRGMYAYHTDTLGWADIGYNIVIDRYGRIYEGRAGGLARGVIGAHAAGFNTGSVGVAVMGNFEHELPPAAALSALTDVLAWQAELHQFDPGGTVRIRSGGSSLYPAGQHVTLPTIVGHRDTGRTACPGLAFYRTFDVLRSEVAAKIRPHPPRHEFPDVGSSRYYDRPVTWLSHHGITNGFGNTGLYVPYEPVTRGQMAAFIWRMAGSPTGYPSHGFPDVSSRAYYSDAVRWMKAQGITDGYGSTGRFEPNLEVTRGEMAAFLWRYVGQPAGDPWHRFSDVSSSRFYDQALRWLRANGITDGVGTSGEYRPSRSISRAEMATMLWRLASTPPAWREARSTSPYVTYGVG